MKVICSKHQDCPINGCPHKNPHLNYLDIDNVGKVKIYCDAKERVCGLRFPKERIVVICKPVKSEKCLADMESGHQEPTPI